MTKAIDNGYYHGLDVLDMVKHRIRLEESVLQTTNLDERDEEGQNALYWAIKNYAKFNISLLLKHNIDLEVKESLHATFFAIEAKNIEVFMNIFTLTNCDANFRDHQGKTLIMKAIEVESMPIIRYLLMKGADLTLSDNENRTILDYIEKCKNEDLYNMLYYRMKYSRVADIAISV